MAILFNPWRALIFGTAEDFMIQYKRDYFPLVNALRERCKQIHVERLAKMRISLIVDKFSLNNRRCTRNYHAARCC